MQKVPKSDLGEVVILDADNNTIESPFQDLESLPQDVVCRALDIAMTIYIMHIILNNVYILNNEIKNSCR